MNNLSLKSLSVILFLLLLLFASIFGYTSIYMTNKFTQIDNSWADFKSQNNEKARLYNSLYESLGYGGMIHNFKNYVLRKKFSGFITLERSLGATQQIINQYTALASTTTEKIALSDIQTMLDSYKKNTALIRIKIKNKTSSSKIDTAVIVNDSLALRALKILSEEIISQHTYFKSTKHKPVLTFSIRATLGYGGMIHAYKNYILRKDNKYKKQVLTAITTVHELTKKYRKLNPTTSEITALQDILSVLQNYRSKIKIIDTGIKNNLSPEEIDAQVTVDDTYALRGLHILDQESLTQIEKKSSELTSLLHLVSNQQNIYGIIVITTTISLAIIIFIIFTRKIIYPVKNISDIMINIANGDLDAYPEDKTNEISYKNTEIGNMKHSLRIFMDNEIKRRAAEMEIRKLALTDPLTGLANRNQFEMKYNDLISLGKRQEKNITLLMIDLDDFKPVNDNYGHAAGDLILKEVSKHLLTIFRKTDLVARLGGDEFSVVMYGTEDMAGVVRTVERLITLVPSPVSFGKDILSIGVSIGIAQHMYDDEDNLDLLMKNADKALYKAKELGKNTYSIYSPD